MRVIAQHSCHIQLVRSKWQFSLTLSGRGWSGWSVITRVWFIRSHLGMYWTQISVSSITQSCPTLWPHGLQHTRLSCPSPTARASSNSCPSKSVMPSNHLILCHPPLLLLPSIFPSIRVFSNELVLHMRCISPSNECSGLISFRMDWLDLLAVQGILESLLQHHSLKASILQRSVFFMVQLSTSVHDY